MKGLTTMLKTLFGRGSSKGSPLPDTNGRHEPGPAAPPVPEPAVTLPAPPAEPVLRSLEEKQRLLAHMVRMVARKVSFGLFVAGSGGTGKSKVITEVLASEGVCPVLLNSHVTPLSLYQTLYQYRDDHVIWLDDCDGIYPNLKILGLLRSALWGQGQRVVSYTSTQLADMPNSFVFTSRIICCANTLPSARNEAFKAVLSRIDVFQLNATNEEILDLMRTLAEKGYGTLSPEMCRQVVDFIARSGSVRQLSLRLYEPSLKKVKYALENGIDWKELVRSQLDQLGQKEGVAPSDSKTFLHACMAQAIADHPDSVKAQEEEWCEVTGKSRATFYRVKKAFEAERAAQGA